MKWSYTVHWYKREKGGSIIRENSISSNLWETKEIRRPLKIYGRRGLLYLSNPSSFSLLTTFPKCLTVAISNSTETWAPHSQPRPFPQLLPLSAAKEACPCPHTRPGPHAPAPSPASGGTQLHQLRAPSPPGPLLSAPIRLAGARPPSPLSSGPL